MNPTAKSALARVMSRKFLVTLMALIVVYQTTTLDLASKIIIAVVASSYVICETMLDRGGQARLLELARAAIHGPPSGAPPSSLTATAALVGAMADGALSDDAKTILRAAKHVLDGAVAGMPTGSVPPDTIASPAAGEATKD